MRLGNRGGQIGGAIVALVSGATAVGLTWRSEARAAEGGRLSFAAGARIVGIGLAAAATGFALGYAGTAIGRELVSARRDGRSVREVFKRDSLKKVLFGQTPPSVSGSALTSEAKAAAGKAREVTGPMESLPNPPAVYAKADLVGLGYSEYSPACSDPRGEARALFGRLKASDIDQLQEGLRPGKEPIVDLMHMGSGGDSRWAVVTRGRRGNGWGVAGGTQAFFVPTTDASPAAALNVILGNSEGGSALIPDLKALGTLAPQPVRELPGHLADRVSEVVEQVIAGKAHILIEGTTPSESVQVMTEAMRRLTPEQVAGHRWTSALPHPPTSSRQRIVAGLLPEEIYHAMNPKAYQRLLDWFAH